MKFTLELEGWSDSPEQTVVDHLAKVSRRVMAGDTEGRIHDTNGNHCGDFELKVAPESQTIPKSWKRAVT